jgi:hypothetical protein
MRELLIRVAYTTFLTMLVVIGLIAVLSITSGLVTLQGN